MIPVDPEEVVVVGIDVSCRAIVNTEIVASALLDPACTLKVNELGPTFKGTAPMLSDTATVCC